MATIRKLPGMRAVQGPHGVYFVRDQAASLYTETKRIINGEVRVVTCCCDGAGMTRKECAKASGNKWPCRCFCHSTKPIPTPEDER